MSKKTERESLDFYLERKYPVTLYPALEGGYVAEIKDLPGCVTQGETAEESVAEVEDARVLWIETAYEHGDDIPLPCTDTQYSGKTLLRMPRSLHQKLAEGANEKESASISTSFPCLAKQQLSERLNLLKRKLTRCIVISTIRFQMCGVFKRNCTLNLVLCYVQ